MDKLNRPGIDISAIMMNLLGVLFLSYVMYMLKQKHAYFRVCAVCVLMMPLFISIIRALRRLGKSTDLEKWVFIIIAAILWIVQSALTGKLHRLFF